VLATLSSLPGSALLEAFGDRAQKVVTATVILWRVVSHLGPGLLVPCSRALRYGTLLELCERVRAGTPG
jgi:exopolyphosphatase/pppGpp-phosphohydrolase